MTIYKPGDIVLVQYPFTNMLSGKQRPAVIVSSYRYNKSLPDAWIMAITSVPFNGYSFGVNLSHWKKDGLLKPSWIKPVVATIEKSMIRKQLGQLHADEIAALQSTMQTLLF
jgi:mRNA interferase MazF